MIHVEINTKIQIPLAFAEEQDERLKPKGNESYIDFDDDDNGDIPVIPNLEEVQEEVRNRRRDDD